MSHLSKMESRISGYTNDLFNLLNDENQSNPGMGHDAGRLLKLTKMALQSLVDGMRSLCIVKNNRIDFLEQENLKLQDGCVSALFDNALGSACASPPSCVVTSKLDDPFTDQYTPKEPKENLQIIARTSAASTGSWTTPHCVMYTTNTTFAHIFDDSLKHSLFKSIGSPLFFYSVDCGHLADVSFLNDNKVSSARRRQTKIARDAPFSRFVFTKAITYFLDEIFKLQTSNSPTRLSVQCVALLAHSGADNFVDLLAPQNAEVKSTLKTKKREHTAPSTQRRLSRSSLSPPPSHGRLEKSTKMTSTKIAMSKTMSMNMQSTKMTSTKMTSTKMTTAAMTTREATTNTIGEPSVLSLGRKTAHIECLRDASDGSKLLQRIADASSRLIVPSVAVLTLMISLRKPLNISHQFAANFVCCLPPRNKQRDANTGDVTGVIGDGGRLAMRVCDVWCAPDEISREERKLVIVVDNLPNVETVKELITLATDTA